MDHCYTCHVSQESKRIFKKFKPQANSAKKKKKYNVEKDYSNIVWNDETISQ